MISGKKKLKSAKIKIIQKSLNFVQYGFPCIFLFQSNEEDFFLASDSFIERNQVTLVSKLQDSLFLANELSFCANLT